MLACAPETPNNTSIVQYLLDECAPVNTQHVNGVTSLMIASQGGHSEVVRVLINYGADVNLLAKDPNVTALILLAVTREQYVWISF